MSFNECKWRKQSNLPWVFCALSWDREVPVKTETWHVYNYFFQLWFESAFLKAHFLCLHKIWTIYFLIHKLLCSYQIDVYCYFRYAHRETTPSITKIECEYRNFQSSNDTHGQEVKMILIDFREKFLVLQNEPLLVMFSFYDLASALGSIFSCLVIFSLPRV